MNKLSALLSLSLALSLTAQDPNAPQPGPEHEKLAAEIGTWDAAMEMVGPENMPMKAKGTSVRKMPLGGFWLVDQFKANIMGMPFTGMGTTGYDPIKKKYVGTWIDSMTPTMMIIEGNWDKAGKVLTMTGTGMGPDMKPARHRMVTTVVNKDQHRFEMFVTMADGSEAKTMTITYSRRVAKRDSVPAKDGGRKEQPKQPR